MPAGCEGEEFDRDGTGIEGLATSGACGVGSEELLATHVGKREGGPGTFESFLRAFGPAPNPGVCPPPPAPPSIEAQYARSAGTDAAQLQAKINPRFWGDASYYVEYGTGRCSEGGCEGRAAFPPPTSAAR